MSTNADLRSLLTALFVAVLFRSTAVQPAENLIGRAEFRLASFEPGARIWQIWKLPGAIRLGRFFGAVH